MILVCPSCATRYIVPDTAIGVNGRQVRCAACKHSWFQQGAQLEPRAAVPEPAPVSAPTPAPIPQPEPADAPEPVAAEQDFHASANIDGEAPPSDSPVPAENRPEAVPSDASDDSNRFDYVGPAETSFAAHEEDDVVRPRRNPLRLWTYAAIAFMVVIAAAGGALYYFGTPQWAVRAGLLADGDEPDLLFYLAKPAERRTLPNGAEYFAFSARIVNSGSRVLPVPPVEVQLRDRQDRLVFSWTTRADKAELKPGEEASINESRLDIPKNAENLSLTFVDSKGG